MGSIPLADDFVQIARNLAYIKQQRKEQQERDNAAYALEQQKEEAPK